MKYGFSLNKRDYVQTGEVPQPDVGHFPGQLCVQGQHRGLAVGYIGISDELEAAIKEY